MIQVYYIILFFLCYYLCTMPSRKILVILIVCLGVVGAVWIFERPNENITAPNGASAGEIADATTTSATGNNTIDWQAILGTVQSTTTVASGLAGTATSAIPTTPPRQPSSPRTSWRAICWRKVKPTRVALTQRTDLTPTLPTKSSAACSLPALTSQTRQSSTPPKI